MADDATPLEIVFFDAGGTLLRPDPPVGEIYARVARRHGVEVSPDAVYRSFRQAFFARRETSDAQDRQWWRDVVARTFAAFGAGDTEAIFEELYTHFFHPRSWVREEGARRTVEAVAAMGIRTGLLSNWDDRLPALLQGLDLWDRLSPRIVSYRVGVEKPHPRIFEAALEAAGVDPAAVLLIGDDPVADVEGARAVGMRAVLYDPGAERSENGVVRRLLDLPDLL
jgi:putative hydrolase of the HAD superfamily